MGEASRRRNYWGTISEARQAQAYSVAESVDAVTEADRRWFERRPHRSHRIRIMSRSEGVQMAAILDQDECAPARPGMVWATVVRQVQPGARLRLHLQIFDDSDLDEAPEALCDRIFDLLQAPEAKRIEAAFRGIVRRGHSE